MALPAPAASQRQSGKLHHPSPGCLAAGRGWRGGGRVYLGVHWPSDVLAGRLFAAGWLHLAESVLTAGRPPGGRPPAQDPAPSQGGVAHERA
jgi:hypothetical protein